MKPIFRLAKRTLQIPAKLALILLLLYVVGAIGCYKTFCPGDNKILILIVAGCAFSWPLLLIGSLLVGVVYRAIGLVWWVVKRFNRLCNDAVRMLA